MIFLALAMSTATLWGRSSAADVKFRLAPVETRETPFEFLTEPRTDIPTPQFFRIVIDRQNRILVVEDPFVQKITLTPLPRLEQTSTPQAASAQSPTLHHSHTPTPYLSGVETMLLRDAETLVEKSER